MDAVMRSAVVRKQVMRSWWQGYQALAAAAANLSSTPEHQVASLKPKLEMLQALGVREEEVEKLVPRVQGYSADSMRENIRFLEDTAGVGRKSLLKLITAEPKGVFGRSVEHSLKPKVAFLKDLGLRDEALARVLPFVLRRSLPGMLHKVTFLESCGVNRDRIGTIIASFPRIFSYNLDNNLKKKITFLKKEAAAAALAEAPAPAGAPAEAPAATEPGAPGAAVAAAGESAGIVHLLTTHPAVLARSLGNLSRRVDFLRSKGLEASLLVRGPCADVSTRRLKAGIKRLLVTFGSGMAADDATAAAAASQLLKKQPKLLFRTAESMSKRCDFLARALQCSIEKAEQIVVRQPSILNQSEKAILDKLEFLVHDIMGYSNDNNDDDDDNNNNKKIQMMMKYPQFLTSSLEGKIKPRHRVLQSLKSLDLLRKKDTNFLSVLLKMSEKEFVWKFVQAHPEAAAVYKGNMLSS